ncbi:MAG: hypothetical protein ACRENE_03765 [Polyangiaceae bacterium]
MRTGLLAVTLGCAVIGGIACGNAPGDVTGGTPLFPQPPDCSASSPDCGSWKHIYACYFDNNTAIDGGCSGAQCHSDSTGTGAQVSGFICGPTQETCWMGITMGAGVLPPLVLSNKTANALFQAFYKTTPPNPVGTSVNNMPLFNVQAMTPYTSSQWPGLTPEHEACIKRWVSAGAPNN